MKKKQKLKKTNLKFYKMESPYKDLSPDEKILYIDQLAAESEKVYSKSLSEIKRKVLEFEPKIVLSYFSFYGFSTPVGVDREITDENPVHQHYIEFLQALILKHNYIEFRSGKFDFKYFDDVFELLKSIADNNHFRRISSYTESMDIKTKYRVSVIEGLRTTTQCVRNWGYPDQIFKRAIGLFESSEGLINEKLGIKFCLLVDQFNNIFNEINNRLNLHIDKLASVFKCKTISNMIKRSHEVFPQIKSSPEEYIDYVESKGWNIDNVKYSIELYNLQFLPDLYTLTSSDIINLYPGEIEEKKLLKVFDMMSYKFGDLSKNNEDYFLLDNPIWYKPFIKINANKYFLPMPGLLQSFCMKILENILEDEKNILENYKNGRGVYLEDEIEKLFKSEFKNAKVYRGSKWFDPESKKVYENDLLVHIDSYFIIIEAKSGKLTDSARRGGASRIENRIKRLIIEPSEQVNRFAKYLLNNKKVHEFKTQKGSINMVDSRKIFNTIRLNITLEHLSALSMRIPALEQAGFIKNKIDYVPSISLNDLEVIFKLLTSDIEKIHYLIRRTEFELNADYFGDEIDLLAFYIETGFNIGEKEFDGTHFILSPLSKDLDPYMLQKWNNEEVLKPQRKMHKWWIDIIKKLEEHEVERWLEIGVILLNFAYDDQLEFVKAFEQKKREIARKPKMEPMDEFVVCFNGPEKRREIIIGFPYKRISREERMNWIHNIVDQAMCGTDVRRTFVMGVNTDTNDYPYSIAALYETN
jgi:hypothetical protein